MTKLKYVVVALANKIFWARRGFGASFSWRDKGGGRGQFCNERSLPE